MLIAATPWWLGAPAFVGLLSVRLVAASSAPIMACDEPVNYWEPRHYLLRGSGLQTWEYSPQFALRSWVYVELHAVALRVLPASHALLEQFAALRLRTERGCLAQRPQGLNSTP